MNSCKEKEFEEFKELQDFKNAVRTLPECKENRSVSPKLFSDRSFASLNSSNFLNSLNSFSHLP
jgi:hypothetical protein